MSEIYTLGTGSQGLNAGKNGGRSALLAFLVYHRLSQCAVFMTCLTIRGSQDIYL